MNERDRKRVDYAKRVRCTDLTQELIVIISHLDRELTVLKELVEPFRKAGEQVGANYPDFYTITVTHPKEGMELQVGHFRRLAQKLKEVKDE